MQNTSDIDDLVAYPNPVKIGEVLKIKKEIQFSPASDLVLYNSFGQIIEIIGKNKSQIDTKRLKPGLYILKGSDLKSKPKLIQVIE